MKHNTKKPKTTYDLREMIRTTSQLYPDKTMYEYKVGKESKTYSYGDYYRDLSALGTALAKRGYAGKKIAVVGDTHPYYTMTYLSATIMNGTIVPLDKELSVDSIVDFVNASGSEILAYTKSLSGKFAAIAGRMPNVSMYLRLAEESDDTDDVVGSDAIVITAPELFEEGQKLINEGDDIFEKTVPDMDKCCAILYTSGTTGTSKGVMLSQNNLITAINASCQSTPFDDSTKLVSLLPINHTYEMTTTQLGGMNLGATIYINPSLKYAARSLSYFKPTAIVVVPLFLETIYKKIWSNIRDKGIEKKVRFAMKLSDALLAVGIDMRKKLFKDIHNVFGGELDTIICGGAPISDKILHEMKTFGISVFEGYGITECSPLVSVNPSNAPRFGSVGIPVTGTSVKVGDVGEDGRGEILVKGRNVMLGYYENKEATDAVFTEDGWFKTGDIGYLDKNGYIFLTGRKKNVIILSNGKNVYPEEIEERFSECKYAKELVVIGRDDTIVAVIFPDFDSFPDMSPEQIKDKISEELKLINDTLPGFKQVSLFEFRDTEFEKTTTKKIKRFLVK